VAIAKLGQSRLALRAHRCAVILPEILITNGQLLTSWQDAKLLAALVGAAIYFWRRSVLLTMSLGMLVYLPLHLNLGW
jgi:branched-subunit amino acid transport protein